MKVTITLSPSVAIVGPPYFAMPASKNVFLQSLELTRRHYRFEVLGYVVMPEHVHFLVSEPPDHEVPLSKALQALKIPSPGDLLSNPFGRGGITISIFSPVTSSEEAEVYASQPRGERFGRATQGVEVVQLSALSARRARSGRDNEALRKRAGRSARRPTSGDTAARYGAPKSV